jgi:hypothetical protein
MVRGGQFSPLIQHRRDDEIRHTLVAQIKDLRSGQMIRGSGIHDEGDDSAIAHLGP